MSHQARGDGGGAQFQDRAIRSERQGAEWLEGFVHEVKAARVALDP